LFMPVITGLYSKKKTKEIRKLSVIITKWIFLLNLPLVLFILFFSKQLLGVAFGSEYVVGSFALSILVFGYLISSLTHTYSSLLSMIKKTKSIMYVILVSTLVNIILNYILIPKIGIVGGAIATTSSWFVTFLLFQVITYKFVKIQPLRFNIVKVILISLILGFFGIVFNMFNLYSFLSLILFGLLFFGIYVILILIFRILDEDDKEVLFGFFKSFRKRINF